MPSRCSGTKKSDAREVEVDGAVDALARVAGGRIDRIAPRARRSRRRGPQGRAALRRCLRSEHATIARSVRARASARTSSAATSPSSRAIAARRLRGTRRRRVLPGPDKAQSIPFFSLYFWRRPTSSTSCASPARPLQRRPSAARSFSQTVRSRVRVREQHGLVRRQRAVGRRRARTRPRAAQDVGARRRGLGYRPPARARLEAARVRRGVHPQRPDNMFSIYLLAEPSTSTSRAQRRGDDFVLPQDTWQISGGSRCAGTHSNAT
jgi:hypothetical protein